jgi:hypothetical protein
MGTNRGDSFTYWSLGGGGGAPSSNPGLRILSPRVGTRLCSGRPVVLLRERAGGSVSLGEVSGSAPEARSRASAGTLIVVFERLRLLTGARQYRDPLEPRRGETRSPQINQGCALRRPSVAALERPPSFAGLLSMKTLLGGNTLSQTCYAGKRCVRLVRVLGSNEFLDANK